jgi:hypothetical protein
MIASLSLLLAMAAASRAEEPLPAAPEPPAPTVRQAYGAAVAGAVLLGGHPLGRVGARGGGDLAPWLHMGGEGYGEFLLDPFLSFTTGGNYFEFYTLPQRRICPVVEVAPSVGFAVGDGFHVFFAPRAGLRLDYAPVPWVAISPGVFFRGAVPIFYDAEQLGWSLEELQGLGFDFMLKTAPRWWKQAKAGTSW